VAKGSFLNKLIFVLSAVLISTFLLWLIVALLVVGGGYLCFEGLEKLAHKFIHSKNDINKKHAQNLEAVADPNIDLVILKKQK
jgi:predicted DNA repair protein MutK